MKKLLAAIVIVGLVIIILLIFLYTKPFPVPVMSDDKIVSSGTMEIVSVSPITTPFNDTKFNMYVGTSKIFSLWGDYFDVPMFIYSFNDQKRFLCVYDYDVEDFVFVVDFNKGASNTSQGNWPSDNHNRQSMARWMTNVVRETKGVVRFPTYAELQEVSEQISNYPSGKSFPFWNLKVFEFDSMKTNLLVDLQTNRVY